MFLRRQIYILKLSYANVLRKFIEYISNIYLLVESRWECKWMLGFGGYGFYS